MAKHLFFLDTGKEGIHLHQLKDGGYLLQQVNEKGEFHSAVVIPETLFDTFVFRLLDVRNEGFFRAEEQREILGGNDSPSCYKCRGQGRNPANMNESCPRCKGTGKAPKPGTDPVIETNGKPIPSPEAFTIKAPSYEEMTKEKKG